jgi:cytochrome P450
VLYNEALGFWTLARFGDVVNALQDPQRYCSSQGVALGMTSEMLEQMPMLVTLDPPRHTQLRTLVGRAFTPRRISDLEDRVRRIAVKLVEEARSVERCDLVSDLAAPLPMIVIAELLGVPVEDQDQFKDWSTAMVQMASEASEATPMTEMSAALELSVYLRDIYEKRRAEPKDDLMSALVGAEIDGEHLTDGELLGFAILLLVAGNETTTNLIGNAIVLMDEHPDQQARLRNDRGALPAAVEEFLRFESPIPALARTLTADVALHGQELLKGQKVMLLFGCANRDERQFEAPDRLDVTRKPTQHLAFGYGTHFCLGASLARLEARVALEELLARVPAYEIDPSRVERNPTGIRGFAALPADLHPAR